MVAHCDGKNFAKVDPNENNYNIAYFAFDQFIPSEHAGFVHTHSIVKALKEIGNDVTLYGIPTGRDLYNVLKWSDSYEGIRLNYVRFIVSFKLKYKLFYPLNFMSYHQTLVALRTQKPDLIHERFHLPNPHSIKISNTLKIPKILEVNSLYIDEEVYTGRAKKIASNQRDILLEQCEVIVTQTETLKKMIGTITDKPVFVVPNGVDTEKFRPDVYCDDLENELSIRDEVIITFVGSFRRWHGVDQIPEIAKRFERENVKFLLIGSGELFDGVKRAKTDNMILLGARNHSEISQYLAMSDILIAPFDERYFPDSEFWWNPVKLFEYMSSGKPVVSYDYKEVKKIVQDAGLLAEVGNIKDFMEKIEFLVENKGIRLDLGNKGREIAVKGYDWRSRAKEIEKVYNKVL
ncbi:MAG: glycosyltransferase [Methanomicrobia archaeon]|nr:glycosyltransferase [Methanomicrobia archaeon]